MNTSTKILAAFLLLALSLSARAQSKQTFSITPSIKDELHTYLNIIYAKKRFSGELLVAKDGDVIFQEAVGLASVEHNLEMTTGASYRIASITKTFTSTLIALAQMGQTFHLKKLRNNGKSIS